MESRATATRIWGKYWRNAPIKVVLGFMARVINIFGAETSSFVAQGSSSNLRLAPAPPTVKSETPENVF